MPCPRCARWKAIPPPPGRRTARRPRNEDHFAATTLPPLAVQSFSVFISVVPWPLQPFWPLHALLALWHEPWPLHSFTPAHLTALLEAFFSFSLAWAAPDANSEPTAAAITAPFSISLTIVLFSGVDTAAQVSRSAATLQRARRAAPGTRRRDQVFARCQASRMPSRVTMPSGRGASGLSTTTASDVPDSESTCSACCRSSSGRSSTRPPVRASSPAVRAADPVSASRAARTGNTPTAKPRSSTTGTAARAPSSARSNSAPEDSAGTAGIASQAWATDRSRSGSSIRARSGGDRGQRPVDGPAERASEHRPEEHRGEEAAAGRARSEGRRGGRELQREGERQRAEGQLSGEGRVHALDAGAQHARGDEREQSHDEPARRRAPFGPQSRKPPAEPPAGVSREDCLGRVDGADVEDARAAGRDAQGQVDGDLSRVLQRPGDGL